MPRDDDVRVAIAAEAAALRERGVRRVDVLAWRDLADPDAGGSEVHADQFMRRFAAAGLEVVQHTSAAAGLPARDAREGYRVVRRGGRMGVFPRTVAAQIARTRGRPDALVEVWNGVPWFSPLWFSPSWSPSSWFPARRRPRVTFVHHVHGPMWDQIFPPPLARAGRALEARVAPPFYRGARVLVPSEATRDELLGLGIAGVGLRPARVTVVHNGVDEMFTPGGERAPRPTVLAVGRIAPVKRFPLLLEAAAVARARVADLRLVIAGDGAERPRLEAEIARRGAGGWVTLLGQVERSGLLEHYRRAWIVSSASMTEGWGLALTEAAACATPAVVSDIRGHRASVVDGVTGVLAPAEPAEELGGAIAALLGDQQRRERLGRAALARARTFTWDASALGILRALRAEAERLR